MTYILQHDAPARSTYPAATMAHVLVSARKTVTGITQIMSRIPAAIAQAFSMAYVDPYQPNSGANDPADPKNF